MRVLKRELVDREARIRQGPVVAEDLLLLQIERAAFHAVVQDEGRAVPERPRVLVRLLADAIHEHLSDKGIERTRVALVVKDVAHRPAIAQRRGWRLVKERLGVALGVELVGDLVGGGQGRARAEKIIYQRPSHRSSANLPPRAGAWAASPRPGLQQRAAVGRSTAQC